MARNTEYKFSIPEGALARKTVLTSENKGLIRAMKRSGRELVERRIAGCDGADLSARTEAGFLITASGVDLSNLSDEDFILVEAFDINSNSLARAAGLKQPPLSTPVHALIYSTRADVKAIIRAEDAALSRLGVAEKLKVPATRPGFVVSTKEAAEAIASLATKSDSLILPGSCAFVLGSSVEGCAEKLEILHRRGKSAKV